MQIVAAGHYNGVAAGAAAAYGERGAVVVRTDAGVYTITLDGQNGVDATEGIVIASVNGATIAAIRVTHTNDLVKTIETETVNGVAGPVDADFAWAVLRYGP